MADTLPIELIIKALHYMDPCYLKQIVENITKCKSWVM